MKLGSGVMGLWGYGVIELLYIDNKDEIRTKVTCREKMEKLNQRNRTTQKIPNYSIAVV